MSTSVQHQPLIELNGIKKSYNIGLPNEAEVLHGLSLSIGTGEFVALIGYRVRAKVPYSISLVCWSA